MRRVSPKIKTAVRLFRQDPVAFMVHCLGQIDRYYVYETDPRKLVFSPSPDGISIKILSDLELIALVSSQAEISEQYQRLRLFKTREVYGVHVGGCIAHTSWLLIPERPGRMPISGLRLKKSEAEIGPCLTLPEYRNRGLYAFAIRRLCAAASGKGVTRILMTTGVSNVASQRGIEKAGLLRTGTLYHFQFRLFPGHIFSCVTRRGVITVK